MKTIDYILFFSIIVLVLLSTYLYIIRRMLQALPDMSPLRVPGVIIVLFLASAFLLGRIAERISYNIITGSLIRIGSLWIACLIYILLFLIAIDCIRLLHHLFGIIPSSLMHNPQKLQSFAALSVIIATSLIVGTGHINTYFPVIKHFTIPVHKNAGALSTINITVASDIHLGTLIRREKMKQFAEMINKTNPDIILLPGDIIDEDITPVLQDNMGESLNLLEAPYGVFAVNGNHEYIGGVETAVDFLETHGITVLRDEVICIADSLYVAGREDRSMTRFSGKERKPLSDILEGVSSTSPVILMDHQPYNLDEAAIAGVDLQLSGHTHNGQLWPFNYITGALYEVSRGYHRIKSTHYYVSSGLGEWGPPIRTNSRPEIITFTIVFQPGETHTRTDAKPGL